MFISLNPERQLQFHSSTNVPASLLELAVSGVGSGEGSQDMKVIKDAMQSTITINLIAFFILFSLDF
jgi:hypothetical protein